MADILIGIHHNEMIYLTILKNVIFGKKNFISSYFEIKNAIK